MSIFGSYCDEVNSDFRHKHEKPKVKADIASLKEEIADLKATYADFEEVRDYEEAKFIASEICSKERKLNNLIDKLPVF